MKSSINAAVLTVFPEGRIDSSNADSVSAEIEKILGENTYEELVLDAENLEYISSAGLRVVLKLRKANPTMKIINASAEIYDIFEMTGFTEMMTVEKAYRRLSVEGCEAIGQGANGKVYRLDPDTIIKVYLNPDCLPDIHRERELARTAFILGIPTAIPYDVVRVGDGYGSVFELLSAKSFAKLIIADPDNLDKYAQMYVDLLKKIHSTEVPSGKMPSMKAVALDWAKFLCDYLPKEQGEKLCALIEAVPESNNMLHGDYHIKNVMLQNGEVLLIDMDTLCVGNPVFEFASVFLAYEGYSTLDHTVVENFLGISYETATKLWQKTLELYFGTTDEAVLSEYAEKAMLIGYTRMMRRTIRRNGFDTPEGREIISMCSEKISALLEKTDSLKF